MILAVIVQKCQKSKVVIFLHLRQKTGQSLLVPQIIPGYRVYCRLQLRKLRI